MPSVQELIAAANKKAAESKQQETKAVVSAPKVATVSREDGDREVATLQKDGGTVIDWNAMAPTTAREGENISSLSSRRRKYLALVSNLPTKMIVSEKTRKQLNELRQRKQERDQQGNVDTRAILIAASDILVKDDSKATTGPEVAVSIFEMIAKSAYATALLKAREIDVKVNHDNISGESLYLLVNATLEEMPKSFGGALNEAPTHNTWKTIKNSALDAVANDKITNDNELEKFVLDAVDEITVHRAGRSVFKAAGRKALHTLRGAQTATSRLAGQVDAQARSTGTAVKRTGRNTAASWIKKSPEQTETESTPDPKHKGRVFAGTGKQVLEAAAKRHPSVAEEFVLNSSVVGAEKTVSTDRPQQSLAAVLQKKAAEIAGKEDAPAVVNSVAVAVVETTFRPDVNQLLAAIQQGGGGLRKTSPKEVAEQVKQSNRAVVQTHSNNNWAAAGLASLKKKEGSTTQVPVDNAETELQRRLRERRKKNGC